MPLKIIKRPDRRHFYISGTVRGIAVFESTGTDNKKVAEDIRIKREAEILNQSVFGKQATVTFLEGAVSYMASGGSPQYLGKELPNGQWNGLIGHFSTKLVNKITQSDLDNAATALYPNAAPDTRNRQVYTPYVAIYNHCVANNWAPEKKWKRPKRIKGTKVKRLITRAGTKPVEYERAFEFVKEMSPAPGLIMTCLFYTGMRPIELLSLDADEDDIRPEDNWLVLSNSKTGEPRGVPIHNFLVPIFATLKARGGRLFRDQKNRPYSDEGSIKTAITGARARTGIKDISPYTGRHTVSTQMVVNKVHPHIKDQILGHAVTDMSRHYTNVPQKDLIEAINSLPVPAGWRDLYWIKDPMAKSKFFVTYKLKAPRKSKFKAA